MTDSERLELKDQLLMADLVLKTRQGFWESPKAIAIIVATTAGIFTAIAGLAGYKLGSTPPQTIIVHMDTPFSIPQGSTRP